MAKKAYVGVDNVARKIKKGYIGVDGVARKIKKAYIGIGGVARPCWSDGLSYYGAITPLSVARRNLAATSVGSYALFGGGTLFTGSGLANDTYYSTVDAYDSSLVRTSPASALKYAVERLAATTVGDYAVFGGGYQYVKSETDSNQSQKDAVVAYNSSLTRKIATSSFSQGGRYAHSATSVGDYAIFGGGFDEDGDETNTTEIYNSSLTRHSNSGKSSTALAYVAAYLMATTVGDYALFGGGKSGSTYRTAVTSLSSSLTRNTSVTALGTKMSNGAAATVGDYAIFTGGAKSSSDYNSSTYAYDSSLTIRTAPSLSVARYNLSATSVGDYAIFAGGYNDTDKYLGTVDVYDKSLTKTIGENLSVNRSYLAATSIGSYALFGGGATSGYDQSAVDAYAV